jgi:tetratricopeptide (TPR) repeat protein
MTAMDYSKICFVIMPFGKKTVGDKEVDFDGIYDKIFVPAITAVTLPAPETGKLEAHRTDKDFFTGDIKQDMFEYLEYSRFAIADISGLNFNVAYELGARHRARESGTAIFRQTGAPLPFDINSIKAFPYDYAPEQGAQDARTLITRVLTESLVRNRLDSPVQLALKAQRQSVDIKPLLLEAENAIRSQDWTAAMKKLREAAAVDPGNPLPRMKLGILLKDRGRWEDALAQFDAVVGTSAQFGEYGEALREKGIAENKLAQQAKQPMDTNPAPGEASLRRAIELNPDDFDALASLGGALRRAKRPKEARAAYEKSAEVSAGHPYPLLNALKLRASEAGKLELTPKDRIALMRAERVRKTQTEQNPPYDSPWSFFDLAEIKLYQGKGDEFLQLVETGMGRTEADWQGKTFLSTLRLLEPASAELPKLKEGIELLEGILGKD